MKDFLEIQFFRMAKWLIKEGYGYCEQSDRVKDCASCRASFVQDWIDEHIELLKT